jgi:hypothetical protein
MTTTTTGVFYVNKDRPGHPAISEHTSDAGEFVLKMRLIDNQGRRAVEVYETRWVGPAAAAWRAAHRNLKAGDALRLVLSNPRAMPGTVSPETHAAISSCELLPAHAPAAAQTA